MTIHHLHTAPKSARMQILWCDYQQALHDFQMDWWDQEATERYLAALRRWMDAHVDDANRGGIE